MTNIEHWKGTGGAVPFLFRKVSLANIKQSFIFFIKFFSISKRRVNITTSLIKDTSTHQMIKLMWQVSYSSIYLFNINIGKKLNN